MKAGRTEDGPSILNNAKVTLADYSKYRYVRENPVYVNKKVTNTKILRVCCSDTETRLEMEVEASGVNEGWYVKGKAYIKGDKGGKQELSGVENITVAPATTKIPWPFQKLRFALTQPCPTMLRSSTSSCLPAPGSSRTSSVSKLIQAPGALKRYPLYNRLRPYAKANGIGAEFLIYI